MANKILTETEVKTLGGSTTTATNNLLCTYTRAQAMNTIAKSGVTLANNQLVYDGSLVKYVTSCQPKITNVTLSSITGDQNTAVLSWFYASNILGYYNNTASLQSFTPGIFGSTNIVVGYYNSNCTSSRTISGSHTITGSLNCNNASFNYSVTISATSTQTCTNPTVSSIAITISNASLANLTGDQNTSTLSWKATSVATMSNGTTYTIESNAAHSASVVIGYYNSNCSSSRSVTGSTTYTVTYGGKTQSATVSASATQTCTQPAATVNSLSIVISNEYCSDPLAGTATQATLTWKATVTAQMSDGTTKTLENKGSHSKTANLPVNDNKGPVNRDILLKTSYSYSYGGKTATANVSYPAEQLCNANLRAVDYIIGDGDSINIDEFDVCDTGYIDIYFNSITRTRVERSLTIDFQSMLEDMDLDDIVERGDSGKIEVYWYVQPKNAATTLHMVVYYSNPALPGTPSYENLLWKDNITTAQSGTFYISLYDLLRNNGGGMFYANFWNGSTSSYANIMFTFYDGDGYFAGHSSGRWYKTVNF